MIYLFGTSMGVMTEYIKSMNMTVEKKRKIVMDHVIRILRRQYGGNDGIHKTYINEQTNIQKV